MNISPIHTYLEVQLQHSVALMWEADQWPERAQEHLRRVWTHVDVMVAIMPLPELPILELGKHLEDLRIELDTLEGFELSEQAIWHLHVLRSSLDYILQVIDEHRYSRLAHVAAIDPALNS